MTVIDDDLSTGPDSRTVLQADHVSVDYAGRSVTHAVRDVSFSLQRKEILGLAGESGCGKSTLAYAVAGLMWPPARLAAGAIRLRHTDGQMVDLALLSPEQLRKVRWREIAMVFQSAMSSLNPVTRIGKQFNDIFRAHEPQMTDIERQARAAELLQMVSIDADRLQSFPHELSGGMRQRVGIAMALALHPGAIVMDEPTTALDVVVQREIMDEVLALQDQLGFGVLFITHDLAMLLEVADRLAIMYAGEIVEIASAQDIRRRPRHPYTEALLKSFPEMQGDQRALHGIPGRPPDLGQALVGCPFAPRCPYAFARCWIEAPRLGPTDASDAASGVSEHVPDGRSAHDVACHLRESGPATAEPERQLDGEGERS